MLKDFNLRQHAGWVKSSNMVEIYTHELGVESSEDLLMAYGIDVRASNKNEAASQLALQAKICPHCSEPNKPDAKFCLSCSMVLTIDEYNATIQSSQEAENAKKELADMRIDMEQVKTKLANTTDQIATMLEILTKINRNQVTFSEPAVKIFLERKLGTMTNGEWGEHESGIVTEPI